MRVIRRLSAVLIGFVFFLAGLLKLMDPVGSSLIVEEYLKFFHIGFLRSISTVIAVVFAFLETFSGAALITGVWRKIVAVVSGAQLAFFTILTLILLIVNPSMDCGCFGEAIKLTHLQSFLKNIALCLLWLLAFIPFKEIEPTRRIKYVSFGISVISVCFFFLYSVLSIPMKDFTPYKPSAELMTPQTYLSFSDANGEYADTLALEPKIMAFSIYEPDKVTEANWNKIQREIVRIEDADFTPIILVASIPDAFSAPSDMLPYCYYADRKTLLTLNRSNIGLSYLSDGQVIAKWAFGKLPDKEKLQELSGKDSTEAMISETNSSHLKLQAFLLYVFAVLLLL